MKLIDIRCPNCSGELRLEDDRESAVCQFCGHEIMLCREKNDDDTAVRLDNLKKLLRTQTASGVAGDDVLGLCDEILRIDPDDRNAWMHKGLVSDDPSTKINCFIKGIEGLQPPEYDECYSTLSSHLADFLFNGDFEEWHPYILAELDLGFSEIAPEGTDNDAFVLEVLDKLADRIVGCTDSDIAVGALDKFNVLSIVSLSIYSEITVQRDILVATSGHLGRMMSNYTRFSLDSDRRQDNKVTAECFRLCMDFQRRIILAIDKGIKGKPSGELERISSFWAENGGLEELNGRLFDMAELNTQLLDAGMLESVKTRKKISQTIDGYVECYLSCRTS